MATIRCLIGDITRQADCDAIVNAANARLLAGGGVCGAIHAAAGSDLERHAAKLGPISPGDVVITPGFSLPNAYVLHALGPVYEKDQSPAETLARCIRNALLLADSHSVRRIALPAISTGVFGYPFDEAAWIMTVTAWETAKTLHRIEEIRFVVIDTNGYSSFRNAIDKLPRGIDRGLGTISVSPLGEVVIKEILHDGAMFTLVRGQLGHQDVVLKMPSIFDEGGALFREDYVGFATDVFVRSCHSDEHLTERIITAQSLLAVEAHIIAQAEGAWNHEVLGIGSIAASKLVACLCRVRSAKRIQKMLPPFLNVLMYPYHDAKPLSAFPENARADLFVRMLPALWDALLTRRHGDITEGNLLVDVSQGKFHVIDPGTYISDQSPSEFGRPVGLDDMGSCLQGNSLYVSVFTTTARNYPVIPPYWDAQADTMGLCHFLEHHRLTGGAHRGQRAMPSACDVMALGIIFFRCLTGGELFLGEGGLCGQVPLWMNRDKYQGAKIDRSLRQQGHDSIRLARELERNQSIDRDRVIEQIRGGALRRLIEDAPITAGQKKLAHALMNLDVRDRDHLLIMVETASS